MFDPFENDTTTFTTKPPLTEWHRLFGIAIERDFLDYSALRTEREKDLSVKEQLLDVLVIYADDLDTLSSFLENPPKPLPDGLDNLSQYNLITYKSLREPLNEWTLQELTGHYVNQRKNTAIKDKNGTYSKLLAESHFRLYAVCTRFSKNLMTKYEAKKIQEGVYEIIFGGLTVRVITLSRIPKAKHNAIWNIFSNVVKNIEYGASQYRPKLKQMSSVLDRLFRFYNLEGTHMAYTFEQFEREHFLHKVPTMLQDEKVQPGFFESLYQTLSLDNVFNIFFRDRQDMPEAFDRFLSMFLDDRRLRKFSVGRFLSRLSPDERLEGLSSDVRLEGLSSDERLEGLSPDEIKAYLLQLETEASPPSQPKCID